MAAILLETMQTDRVLEAAREALGVKAEFFWLKTEADHASSCTLWTGSVNGCGYGYASVRGVPETLAHRVAWHLTRGPIPFRRLVLHRCDVPACVNVDHLYLGTHRDNARDCVVRGRHKPGRFW